MKRLSTNADHFRKCLLTGLLLGISVWATAQVRINGREPFTDRAKGRLLYVTTSISMSHLSATVEPMMRNGQN